MNVDRPVVVKKAYRFDTLSIKGVIPVVALTSLFCSMKLEKPPSKRSPKAVSSQPFMAFCLLLENAEVASL